jgi:alkylation response protein AidB-like acyl-CoA dehydrogenase
MALDTLTDLRDATKQMLERNQTIARLRRLRGHSVQFERESWQEFAAAGWFGVLVSQDDGGLDLGLAEMSAIAQEVGEALLPEPYLAAAVQSATVLSRVPDGSLRTQLLKGLVGGELILGLAWQDRMGQLTVNNTAQACLLAEPSAEGGFLLNGQKRFVAPGQGADGWLVLAAKVEQTQTGQTQYENALLFWLPADTPGLVSVDQVCVDGSAYCELSFTNLFVGPDQILATGAQAVAAIEIANEYTRLMQAAELLGLARRSLQLTIEYVNTRKQFGRAIGSFQALKHRIVDGYVQVELSSACLNEAIETAQMGGPLAVCASRAKARCASTALMLTRTAIQLHGAMGYTDECNIGLYFKRAMQLSSWLGGVQAHRQRYLDQRPPEQPIQTHATPDLAVFPKDANWDDMSEADFRSMLRAFYAKHYPTDLRHVPRRLRWSEIKNWSMTLSHQGWIAPAWPKQFGGMGLAPDKMIAYVEEQEQFGVARAPDMGVVMIGPLLIQHGTKAQQEKFLPKILTGENIWCQGYSEPGAGSDLAALRTEAVLDGDHFVVNGQKIWTTLAQDATHMFALVRTDKEAKKQAGISFLLIDLSQPGITIRPILDIGGHEEFCEVFFDQVQVPAENLVGQLNQGWTMAKALLGFERIFLGSPKQSRYALSQLDALAQTQGLFDDPVFCSKYAELMLDVADQVAGYTHYADMVKRGEALPPSVSLLKIWGTDTYQRICTLLVEVAQEYGAMGSTSALGVPELDAPAILFNAIPSTIYGGSTEIQKEIIAKNVLHLPD